MTSLSSVMGLHNDGRGTGDGDIGVGLAGLVLVVAGRVGMSIDYSRELGWGGSLGKPFADRLLDPEKDSVTLITLEKAALVLGKRLQVALV